MKFSAKELLQEDIKGWHSVPMKERVPDDVKGIVYYPCLTQFSDYDTALKAFRRIRRIIDYARQKIQNYGEFWDCQATDIGHHTATKLHHEAESRKRFLIQQFATRHDRIYTYFYTDRVQEV